MSTSLDSAAAPRLVARAHLDEMLSDSLAELFKALGNSNRLKMLHGIITAGERCVTDIAADVEMSVPAVSNQLQRLTTQRILASRRDGNRIFYRVVDPCVPGLMDLGVCLLEDAEDGGSDEDEV